MKKFMKKCKKALVIAMAIILVGTSIDTSTLYVRAENATDVTEGNGDLQNQLGEGGEGGDLQNQLGEGGEGGDLQNQLGEGGEGGDLQNQLGEGGEGGDLQNQLGEGGEGGDLQNQLGEGGEGGDLQNQPENNDFIFGGEEIIELPEPGTSVPAMGFFSLADGNVTLAAGTHVEYIDRIDLSGDAEIFKTLYANMEEWSDNDGTDDWMITGEKDQYLVATVSGKAIAAEGQNVKDAVAMDASAIANRYSQYIGAVAEAFDRDHPEVFWLGSTPVSATWYYNPTTGDYTVYVYVVLNVTDEKGNVTDIRAVRYRDVNVLKAAIATMNTNANAILAGAEGLDTVEKIKYFNEKLTKINEYNTIVAVGGDESNVNRDAWECVSALAGQTGEVGPVCEAYARAFKVLCDRSGIPCILEDGFAGGPHMWNAVQVGDIWYATDITWNDPTGGNSGAVSGYESESWLLLGTNTIPAGETETFSASHVRENSPSGTLQYLNGPTLSTEKYLEYEASVTTRAGVETKYETFGDAFWATNDAGPEATLKLLKSVNEINSLLNTGNDGLTFDLNGYELKVLRIFVRGNVTIIDSSAQKTGKLCGRGDKTIEVAKEGVLTIAGGTITDAEGSYRVIYNEGTATITGGRIEGRRYAFHNAGSLNISGTPTIVGGGSESAIWQCGENLLLSGGAVITGGDGAADIKIEPYENANSNPVNGKFQLVGALTNTTPYSVSYTDADGKSAGVFAEGGVDPNDNSGEVYVITASDAAKFTSANQDMSVKRDTTNNQLLLAYKPHVHNAQETFENPWTATNGTVTEGSYYLTEDVTADGMIDIEGTVALCLNGHTLDMGTDCINVSNGAALLVYDCSDTNKGVITGKGSDTVTNYGTFILMNGKIANTAGESGVVLYNGGGTIIIEAGSLQSMSKYSYGIYNYSGSLMVAGGSIQALDKGRGVFCAKEGRIQLSGAPVMEGGECDFELADEAQIKITGALTGSDTYTLYYLGEEKNVVATVTDGAYTAEEAKSKFVAVTPGFKIVTSGQDLIWDYQKHVHQLVLSNSLDGVENAQAVEVLCTNNDGSICELPGSSYYVTIKAPDSLEYDYGANMASVEDRITSNIAEATVSPIAYYVKSGSTWTAVSEVGNVGTYKAEVTVTIGNSSKKAVVEFTIAKKSSEGLVDVTPYLGWYDPFAPEEVDAIENISLYHSGLEDTATIEYSTDGGSTWSPTVPKMTGAGSMSVTVRVTSPNFTEYETTVLAVMTPYDLSSCTVELEQDQYYYTGQQIQPKVTGIIAGTGEKLPLTTADYKVTYGENNSLEEPGSVSVEATNSNYINEVTIKFGISYYNGEVEILYNGSEFSDNYYNDDVAISAQGYTVSKTLEGPYTESVMLSGEGTWVSMEVYFKQDGTGYITWPKLVEASIDKTAPTFEEEGSGIWIEDKIWNTLAEEITYDVYFKEAQYGFITSRDVLSGIDPEHIYYYIDKSGSTTAKTAAELDACEFTRVVFEDDTTIDSGATGDDPIAGGGPVTEPDASGGAASGGAASGGAASGSGGDFILDEEGEYVVYAYVCDRAGNKSEYISTNGIVIDTKAPVVEVIEPTKEAGTLKDTSATFTIESDEDATALLQMVYNYSGEEVGLFFTSDIPEGLFESVDVYPFGEQVEMDDPEEKMCTVVYKVALKAGEAQTFTITGLLPNTEYMYAMMIYDEAHNVSIVGTPTDAEDIYDPLTFTTLKTIPTFAEDPTITGTYGDKLSEMTLSQPVSTNDVAGTWSIVYEDASQADIMPKVGDTDTYVVRFTPAENAEWYEVAEVEVVPTVAKKAVTATIQDSTITYGDALPNFECITEGVVAGDVLDITLKTTAVNGSDAGTYPITGICNDKNYEVTFVNGTLTIAKADASLTIAAGKDSYTKTFRDESFVLSGITKVGDGAVVYTVKDSKNAAGQAVAQDKVITVDANGKVTITGAGSAVIVANVEASVNYNASETVEITVTVAKADIDAVNISKIYLYLNDTQDTIDLSVYVPVDAGNVTYSVGAASGECEFAVAPTVTNGKLSYTVKAGEADESAFFMATVNSDNYKSLVIKVNVTLVDKTPVAEKSGSEVSLKNNTLTYGEALSKLEFNEAVFVAEGTDEVVSGTLAWETPDYKPNVSVTKATWIFTPDDDKYMSVTGELAIVVEKAEQPTLSIADLGDVEYAPNKELTIITTGGIADGELTISVPANNGVIELSADGKAKVIGAGTVIITAVNVDPDGNYEDAIVNYELIVAKAQQPELSIVPVTDASYGMEGSVWLETTGGLDGAEITFSVPENNGVVTDVNANGLGKYFVVPIGSGKVVVTAVAVDPNGNYEDAIATYELNVAPASIKADWISWMDGFAGAGTYNGNEITPGVKVYFVAEGTLIEGTDYTVAYVNNTYAYTLKEGDEGFDAAKAPAVVVTGKGNYTGSVKVYFVINKADEAPNMPKSTQAVASHIATAGQVSLPTDWIWQDPNAALTEGGETIAVAVYNGADKGNYVKETVYVTITRMEAGVPYVSKINGKDVAVIEKGWEHVSDVLDAAAESDIITVEMNGVTVLPGNVIDNIKGKDITVELNMGNGVTWTINGKDITAATVADVDLKVDLNTTNIPVEVINKITGEISIMQISLAHDGDFGYKAIMTINLSAANAGYYAQLFHYEESAKVLKYITQSKIDATGIVAIPFTHASEYAIVIDDAAYQVPGSGGNGGGSSAPAATPAPTPAPTQVPPTTKLPNTADEFPLEGLLLLMALCAAGGMALVYGKRKMSGR